MGYTTNFEGELKFTGELTIMDLARLNDILGEGVREHDEWDLQCEHDFYYVDFDLLKDFSGIKHSGAEKSYNADHQVNAIIELMRRANPTFGLEGALQAQGEEIGDVWQLAIIDGMATHVKGPKFDDVFECPCCRKQFRLSNARKVS